MSAAAYAELCAASGFSFLRGASRPEELALAAKALGLAGLGLADRNTVAGTVRLHQMAREIGLSFAPGARLAFADGTPDILAFPRDRTGWASLCRLLTAGNMRAEAGECRLMLDDLLARAGGLSLALLAPDASGTPADAEGGAEAAAAAALAALCEAAPGAVRLALARRFDGFDTRRMILARGLAARLGTPLLAVGDVLFHAPDRRPLADVMTAIREHVPLGEAGLRLSPHAERHLKGPAEMRHLFRACPEAVEESLRFFSELAFDLTSLRYEYPDEISHLACTPAEELRRLTFEGAARRYDGAIPDNVVEQIESELRIIAKREYEPYFLTVHRIVRVAREELGILCQGRGSAANSAVCFCLGITEVSPDKGQLLFERFISPNRGEPPDIDIDFEHERRDEVIRWIYGHYGPDNAALAATVITYRARSSLREVGKAFGLSEDTVSALTGSVWGYEAKVADGEAAASAGLAPGDPVTAKVLHYAAELAGADSDLGGFPRHLSQHVGGFVLTRGRIDEVVPVRRTAMEGRTIVEWDKDDLDALRILKIDILALGMLSAIRRAFDLLKAHYGVDLTLAALCMRKDDEPTYAMTRRADTIGVFQIESRAQMTMLPKLRPREFYDFVIQVAIVRPGPIQGDMVHPYLRRRMGLEEVVYPKPEIEAVLARTKGVPLFQEQAMKIAIVAGGFSPEEADHLRRSMASFRRGGKVQVFRDKMVNGMVENGYERDFAERCFKQIEGFGEYGFPESHAASFALLVYVSAYLKCHYPDVFCASLLNAQPMGFYAPAQLVRDALDHGVEVRPVDVNHSRWDSTLEKAPFDPAHIAPRHREMRREIRTDHALRLGFRRIKGLSENEMRRLVWVRDSRGPFDSVRDLWLRSGLDRGAVRRLAEADAFGSLGLTRREAIWAAEALDRASAAETLPLFLAATRGDLHPEPDAHLPPMPLGEEVINDYRFLSLSLKAHPVSFVRAVLAKARILPNARLADLKSGSNVSASGLVLVRQRPGSARGVVFMTIEDETGVANIIVWKTTFERLRPIVLGARFVKVTGRLQSDRGVIHLVAEAMEDLTHLLADVARGRTDFSGIVARADHVRHPLLRPGHPRRQTPAAVPDESLLAEMMSRADEIRRPIDEDRLHRDRLSAIRREAIRASYDDARPLPEAGVREESGEMRTVLPKGRNFH